jgi:hypothetical protein
MGRAHHLPDERLYECYVAERGGEPLDPPAAEHLADCGECDARYGELTRFMEGLRSEVDAETDEIFPQEWQDAQRQQIARRISHVGRAARVISFPGRLVARHMGRAPRVAPRWAAAAAAAGLFVGVAVGMFYDARARRPLTVANSAPAGAVVRPTQAAATISGAAAPLDIDAFLEELEGALGGPRTPELMSLDVLTPHVRDIVLTNR